MSDINQGYLEAQTWLNEYIFKREFIRLAYMILPFH